MILIYGIYCFVASEMGDNFNPHRVLDKLGRALHRKRFYFAFLVSFIYMTQSNDTPFT